MPGGIPGNGMPGRGGMPPGNGIGGRMPGMPAGTRHADVDKMARPHS